MVSHTEAIEAVGELAAGQWGLVTSAQARAEGISSVRLARMAEAGALERLRHGVYRVAGVPAGPLDELRAAWLAFEPATTARRRLADPDVQVVSHRSAALVHRLGDLDADRLEFSSPTRKQARDPQIRIHRRRLAPERWNPIQGLPVTTMATTIGDLAAARIDGGHLAGVVRDAVTSHHLDIAEVADALSPSAHFYGAPLGQGAVLVRQLLQEAGIPESTQVAGLISGGHGPSIHSMPPVSLSASARMVIGDPAVVSSELTRRLLDSAAALSSSPAIDLPALDLPELHPPEVRVPDIDVPDIRKLVDIDALQEALRTIAQVNTMAERLTSDVATYNTMISSIDTSALDALRAAGLTTPAEPPTPEPRDDTARGRDDADRARSGTDEQADDRVGDRDGNR